MSATVDVRALGISGSVDISGDGGVIKRILVPGNASAARPPPCAIVVVHFIAWLSNGTQIASTRNNAPLELRLGAEQSESIYGWELTLPTMLPGEKALVTCQSAYAYGYNGAPPLIPPHEALSFELDLLSWRPNVSEGGTAPGISRRWIDKLVALQEEGISMPTASANEMLHEMVREENQAAAAASAAPLQPDNDEAEDDEDPIPSSADLLKLRDRAQALKRQSGGAGAEAEMEVVGGGMLGQPLVQELYRKTHGQSAQLTWTEGRNDLEVLVPIAEHVEARSVRVELKRRLLRVEAGDVALDGELVREIDVEASSWLIQPAVGETPRCVYLLLVKRSPKEERWGAVFARDAPLRVDDALSADVPEPVGSAGGGEYGSHDDMDLLRRQADDALSRTPLLQPLELHGGRELEGGGSRISPPSMQQMLRRKQDAYSKRDGESARHTWTEGRSELEVLVPIAEHVEARSVRVELKRRLLRVEAGDVALDGELVREIDVEASSWLIQPAMGETPRCVYLLLVKRSPKEERWGAVFSRDAPPRVDDALSADVPSGEAHPGMDDLLAGLGGGAFDIHYDLPRDDRD